MGRIEMNKEYYNSIYKELLDAATNAKIDHPVIIANLGAAQSCIETGFGKHAPQNNYFGIKGKGGVQETKEFISGKWETITAAFVGYSSRAESAKGYVDFLVHNPRYKSVLQAKDIPSAIEKLADAGYATDPNYAKKLLNLHQSLIA